ncbi:substrate-binding domain-containing protein [Mycolicibacterium sp.]|uniref:substrate-binding domain-containing protein n=1 Tax=Mycolicibacterium sp. TaxID=2320850 RepID=UPI001A2A888E|nr:substrate-binding domain-containing protein [Mycolicibacterium sp.]MBJ7340596.1 substrate-binding domain-containing protein [Mycolicibacterium sp.]
MGRHSIPDPEDSADAEPIGGSERGGDRPGSQYPDGGPYIDERHDGAHRGADDDYDAYDEYQTDDRDTDDYRDDDDDGADAPPYGARGGAPDAGFWRPDSGTQSEPDYSYLEEPEPATQAFASTPPPPNRRDWESSEWTGSHRAIQPSRRGISVGVIVALVTVVVVVGAVIAWRFFGDALSSRSQAGAARCVAGQVDVAVVVDPSITDEITSLADEYGKSADPVGDRCVKIGVKSADSDQVINGFAGQWPGELGERPALWIPGSSISEARLEASTGAKTVSDSRSLVTSPVMLAIRPQLKNALAQQNWGTLPGLQTNPTSLEGLNLPGWGSLRMALPLSGDADATYLAAEAVASASAPQGQPPTAGANAIASLMAGQPKLADGAASTAMDALIKAGSPAAAEVHAVVATEQQIFQRGAQPDAKGQLASWLPPGPTALADYPTVLLAGNWLSQEQVSAASEFARYLRKPEALASLSAAGFRAAGTTMPQSDVTDFAPLPATLSVGDGGMRATLANLVSTPAQNPAVTVLLDQSMTPDEGGKSRLANVTAALTARLQALPPNSAVGLWTFDGVAGRSEVPVGPLDEQVAGEPRSTVLTTNLNGQVASNGGAVSFTTLRLLYPEAVANFREGQPNSVLVITAGPHTDQSLDGAGLQDFIKQNFNQARPVAVDVIDFGGDPDRGTWEAVAQATGGNYQNLASSAGPELVTALTTALG